MEKDSVIVKVIKIGQLNLQGNIIDDGWFMNITYSNGKPNMIDIMILAEIIYWYRPTIEKDELTGKTLGFKKKFKSDLLQKSYQSFADRFGISKRQVKAACDVLKNLGLIKIEFRNIANKNRYFSNVMFIEPIPEKIREISILYAKSSDGVEDKDIPPHPTLECKTYTKTTTETIYNNNNVVAQK